MTGPQTWCRRPGLDPERSRLALSWLRDQDGEVDIETWAVYLAATEEDAWPSDVTDDERAFSHAWLYFAFVPRLVRAGLLERDRGVVRLGADDHEVEAYLASLRPDTGGPPAGDR